MNDRRTQWQPALLLLAAAPAFAGSPAEGDGPRPAIQPAQDDRRRDPFRAGESGTDDLRPPGLAGVEIMKAVVRGIVRSVGERGPQAPGVERAIIEAETGEGFVARPGDRLLDGVLGRVEAEGVVFWLDGDPDRRVFRPIAPPAETRAPGDG